MDKLGTGIMIALAALLLSGTMATDVMAAGTSASRDLPAPVLVSVTPAPTGNRGVLVAGLVLALEALRTVPAVLDQPEAPGR